MHMAGVHKHGHMGIEAYVGVGTWSGVDSGFYFICIGAMIQDNMSSS